MELIVLSFAGFISTIVSELIKRSLKISGQLAVILSFSIAILLTVGVGYVRGDIISVYDFVQNAVAYFGIATLAYKLLIKSFNK